VDEISQNPTAVTGTNGALTRKITTMNHNFNDFFSSNRRVKNKHPFRHYGWVDVLHPRNGDFTCTHCHQLVSADPLLSGVNNRNHCPYCLWSRHMDLFEAGDRLAACKAPMQPLGLALKQTRKKYGRQAQGELMLVHRCTACGRASLNRIAADDDSQSLFEIFENALEMDAQLKAQLAQEGIRLLACDDLELVKAQLLGKATYLDIIDQVYCPASDFSRKETAG
jgi:hypothetical protein